MLEPYGYYGAFYFTMIKKTYLKKLASIGYSIIPVGEDKVPIGTWKKYQTEPRTPEEVDLLNSPMFGFVTGVNGLECIDVDLKVLTGYKEQKEWFDEYVSFLEDNIEDFKEKFVIAKTRNAGFHILYRCKNPIGNTKIARLEGCKEAILESRGIGGYIFVYENFLTEKEYHNIQEVSEYDREVLWSISKTYNYIEPQQAEIPRKSEYVKQAETDITPWDDFNSKHTALDLVSDEFKIVRNTAKTYVIKRHGADSPHSGYIFKDSGCMYLFSTGTHYPSEKLLSPFSIYAYRHHFGDFTKASSELYQQGFGTRRVSKSLVNEPPKIEKQQQVTRPHFPIEIYPASIQQFIVDSSKTLGLSVDYMGCSFLWVISMVIGNTNVIEVKPGWKENAQVWIALVGKPGIGKTPSVNQIIQPLRALNIKEQKNYQKEMARFIEYDKLDKKEKAYMEEVHKPKSRQFIVGDVTLEALIDLHEENPNAIGIFKDELAGWFKDMNKYRAGSDLEFWLSSWSGQSISLNRKTSKSAFVDKPFIPVLGGIQPSIFDEFTIGANKENGFIDRILISYPELTVNLYNDNYMDSVAILWYNDFIQKFKTDIEYLFYKTNEQNEIIQNVVVFNEESKQEWIRIHDEITNIQNSDDENEYMKSMLPKQKSYLPRFALLLNVLWSYVDENYSSSEIHKDSILSAEKLSKYFISMAKMVKQDSREKMELKKVSKDASSSFDKFKLMYVADPELNRSTVAEMLEVSRKTVYQWIKKLDAK